MFRSIKFFLTLSVVLLTYFNLNAQDIIHRKNGKTIAAKIVELNPDDVKYKTFDQPNGATFTIDINLVKKIVFENGTVQNFNSNETAIDNPELYEGQKRNAYKIGFLTPIFGHTVFAYEHNQKPGKSIEFRLSIIGLGKSSNDYSYYNIKPNTFGLGGTVGYKFYHKPDYYTSRQRYAHILKGGYIRPEINLSTYGKNSPVFSNAGSSATSRRVQYTFGSMILTFGKQWILDNSFAIDIFAGAGLGFKTNNFKNTNGSYYNESYSGDPRYGYLIADNGLALNFGFNIGLLGK